MTSFRDVVCVWVCLICFLVIVKARVTPDADLSDPRVKILLSIKEDLGFPDYLDMWKEKDPCEWYGVECSNGNVTAFTFIFTSLNGTISPHLAELTSLQIIDLSYNRLTGTIPSELTKLKHLASLDVSNNLLHGNVPYFGSLVVCTDGNPGIQTKHIVVISPKRNKPRKINKSLVVGLFVATGVGLVFAGAAIVWYIFRKKIQSIRLHSQQHCVFPLQVLKIATENFHSNHLLGRGSFGLVYKGTLQNGTVIAVKKMHPKFIAGKGRNEFRAEVSVLTKLLHRNIVTLRGFCDEEDEMILVYEYMTTGSLSKNLFHWESEGLQPLPWITRLRIALDISRGLEYLHTLAHPSQSYIHRDLKPENILLGNDLQAKLADFGLVWSATEGTEPTRIPCVGTEGYIAPEYRMTGMLTTKADVFSFGVILMELVTGQEALDRKRPEDSRYVPDWFWRAFSDKATFPTVIDRTIDLNEENRGSICEVSQIAIQCCTTEVSQRPEMVDVVSVLTSLTSQWRPTEAEENRHREDATPPPEVLSRWNELQLDGESSDSIREIQLA